MSDIKKVVIIGSGLGGLSCGVVLAKNGYDITVLEQGDQIGGCLQCFTRRGAKFETGMHFIGSAAKGQILDMILEYLEVKKDITLSPLNPDCYDVVSIYGEKFKFPNGSEQFIEKFSTYFPKEKDNILKYWDLVKKVAGASSLATLQHAESDEVLNMKYQMLSINGVLDEIFTDEKIKNVLIGNLPLYAAIKDKTPFATHAFVADFYNQSAFRIVGGSDSVAISLRKTIEKYGGKVLTKHKATKIVCDSTKALGVETQGGVFFEADYFIAGTHPLRALQLIDSKLIRPAFRNRIMSIPQTPGVFCVYVRFKENTVKYMNSNFYGYNTSSTWNCESYTDSDWPKNWLYMHLCHKDKAEFAQTGVILAFMQFNELQKWVGTPIGRRGEDYENFKTRKAEQLIASVEKQFPGLQNSIASYYTSTPLTYFDYTGTERGSMYGIAKDIHLGATGRVPHKTRIPNLFLTGQNINTHGILGVIVGTIVTCSEFLTAETIYQQILEANK
jgi:all-trans-retinol 13,14-reductase